MKMMSSDIETDGYSSFPGTVYSLWFYDKCVFTRT